MNKSSVVKNEKYVVDIIDNGFEGEGIAKIDGLTVFVPGSIKGEKCEILIVKVLASHAYGKIVNIIEKSENRKESDCATYKRCGGCSLRHMTYESTLKLKRQVVQNLVNKGLTKKVEVLETIGMENPYNYRNKAQYPVGLNSEGQPEVGVFAQRTHTIIPIQTCLIQTEISQKIAKTILNFVKEKNIQVYNEENQKGLLRHIVIKVGKYTNQVMCILVVNDSKFNQEQELVKLLCEKYPEIKTIVKNINNKNTNVILGKENINLYGNGYIEDKLGEYIFKISPMSFYQVNPVQAEILYTTAINQANLDKNDILFDLYCGIGTISLFMSKFAKKVYGIEIVEEAVKMAKENAQNNNVSNTEFFAGDVEIVLDDLINNKGLKADVVMFDPPRKGLDKKSIDNILNIRPKKIVYISCNPATLIRDLADFENEYDIKTIIPVDMFPFTSHVECVATLQLK